MGQPTGAQERCYPESVPRVRPKRGPLHVALAVSTMLRCWPAAALAAGVAMYRHHQTRRAAAAIFDAYNIETPSGVVASQVAMWGLGAWVFAIGVVSIVFGVLRMRGRNRWWIEPAAAAAGGVAMWWLINPLVASTAGALLVWASRQRVGERASA